MIPAAPFPSATSTSGRPVCRFCLDGDETISALIRPCNCRGTVALVHSTCLEKWVETNKNLTCQMCKIPYEQKSAGYKPMSQWTWPRALSEDWEDKLDFTCAVLWTFYLLRFVTLWMKIGTLEMQKRMSTVVGEGKFYIVWWVGFWLNTIYYGAITIVILDNWLKENTTYTFKDQSTAMERREWFNEGQNDGTRSEIKRVVKRKVNQ